MMWAFQRKHVGLHVTERRMRLVDRAVRERTDGAFLGVRAAPMRVRSNERGALRLQSTF
jgi:hypothetical protein